jgi:hypothetical protein
LGIREEEKRFNAELRMRTAEVAEGYYGKRENKRDRS